MPKIVSYMAVRDEIESSGKISILSQFKMAGGEGVRE